MQMFSHHLKFSICIVKWLVSIDGGTQRDILYKQMTIYIKLDGYQITSLLEGVVSVL